MPRKPKTFLSRAAVSCAAVALLSPLALAGTASAATDYVSNTCSSQAFCFNIYYSQNSQGGVFLTDHSVADQFGYSPNGATLVRYVFQNGTGQGQGVRNNAASAYNLQISRLETVYYSPNYQGHAQSFNGYGAAGNNGNFDSQLRNNNASNQSS